MAGIKRSREEFSASSGTSPVPAETEDAHYSQQPPANREHGDTHAKKKLKVKETTPQEYQGLMPPLVIPKSVAETLAKQKNTARQKCPIASAIATNADEDMSDAPSVDGDKNQNTQVAQQASLEVLFPVVARVPTPRVSFTLLSQVLAADMSNNPYAPTDSIARQHYLDEVGQLQLHPTRTPQNTPQSRVSQQIRDVIYERLFLGFTNGECIPTYHAHGGNANSGAAISKVALPEMPKWFAEEGVVLPWSARKDSDKKRLKDLKLGPKNFPAPHATKVAVPGAVKAPKTSATTRAQINPTTPTVSKPAKQVPNPVTVAGADPEDSQMSDENESVAQDRNRVDMPHEVGIERDENEATTGPQIAFEGHHGFYVPHLLVRAGINTFSVDGDGNEVIVQMVLGGEKYKIHSNALSKHCGLVRNTLEEGYLYADSVLDLEGLPNPVIVRAFINAISPTPMPGLPTHDFEFDETCTYELYEAQSPLNLAKLEDEASNVTIRKIIWNLDSCIQMYDFAKTLDCTVVKDMVIDRISEILSEDKGKTGDEQTDLPLHELCAWSVAEDAKILRAIANHHMARLWPEDGEIPEDMEWPEGLTEEQIKAIYKLCLIQEEDQPMFETPQDHCSWYHMHGKDEKCYKELAKDWMAETHGMLPSMYADLRERSAARNKKEAEEHRKVYPRSTHNRQLYILQGEFMQWSLRQEEMIATIWCEGYAHAMTILRGPAREADKKLQKLEAKLRKLESNYNRGVRYYLGRFVLHDGTQDITYGRNKTTWPYSSGNWTSEIFNEQVKPSRPVTSSW
jgi:hypothetical protein